MTMLHITPAEYRVWSEYIAALSGIQLQQDRAYLLESRLTGLIREQGCGSFAEFYAVVAADETGRLEKEVIDRITTRETRFFRDRHFFEALKYKIIPELMDRKMEHAPSKRRHSLRIWSLACSTGQEAYSIAMALQDLFADLQQFEISILGTDISERAIARASAGRFSRLEVERGLSEHQLKTYFTPEKGRWKIREDIRRLISFQTLNVLKPFPENPPPDIIFCRNVAIYFSRQDRQRLFARIAGVLAPAGFLLLGASETLSGISQAFIPKRSMKTVYYQLYEPAYGPKTHTDR